MQEATFIDGKFLSNTPLGKIIYPYALYNETYLARIHQKFGHPSVKVAKGLLKAATGGVMTTELRKWIENTAVDFSIWRRHSPHRRHFKLTGRNITHEIQPYISRRYEVLCRESCHSHGGPCP